MAGARISISKAQLRAEGLARRDALSPDQRLAWSRSAARIAADHLGQVSGKIVSLFWPIRSEIDTRPLYSLLLDWQVKLALPAVVDRETIVFRHWDDGDTLVPGAFGTREPEDAAPIVDPDILIVPIASFDRSGTRLGYGAGHYDRAIERLLARGMEPYRLGYAFACQEVPYIPTEHHDQPLDAIATDAELITCSDRRP